MWNKEPIIRGNWIFEPYAKVSHAKILSADTETKLYYNDRLLDERTAYQLMKRYGQAWIKKNIEVRAYALMLSDGENFALFQDVEDFINAIAMLNADIVYWYNARFDFAILDYYFLTHDWKDGEDLVKDKRNYGKLPDKTYVSLNGDFGQRYSLTIWKSYKSRKGNINVHKTKMFDICNIFGGGLKKNLEDWHIVDKDNNEVRKLSMDYVASDIHNEEDLKYMIVDTQGLALLSQKIDATIKEITGFSLYDCDYMTAGGLSKKTFLKFMYGNEKQQDNIDAFRRQFPMAKYVDEEFRKHKLYQGGKCLINPNYVGVVQKNIYKYDVNSMYPDKMRNMEYPVGKPYVSDIWKRIDKRLKVLKIANLTGYVKEGKIGIYQDFYTGDFVDVINETEVRYIWEEELRELEKWYNLSYDVIQVLYYEKTKPQGIQNFIDTFYDMKKHSKGALKLGAKLLLNSSYGKLAQRIERVKCHYELSEEGYVHLVKEEPEIDENGMLSVLVGSRITALARVSLMQYIREICNEDVEHNFIYCDTDSVHSLTEYKDTDQSELGKMKCEGIYSYGLYVAPKTYIMYDNIMEEDERNEYEVHCKGVNTKVVKRALDGKPFNKACRIFTANKAFKCLSGINVKGGKALIYSDKVILNDLNYKLDDSILVNGVCCEF